MVRAIVVGASGYAGAELVQYLQRHPHIQLQGLYVSAQSQDAGKPISTLHGHLYGLVDLPLQPLSSSDVAEVAKQTDLVLLATAHEVSHELAPLFLAEGKKVFDLSGAFRVQKDGFYSTYYGFEHQHSQWLDQAIYGLAEWKQEALTESPMVAVPGCYPTASLCALKPLQEAGLLADNCKPVINAVSGVSGAGRKAALGTSFCEVSLNAYGVFNHRHQPEISAHLGRDVVFTPHLGNFKRGILATIYVTLQPGTSDQQIEQAFGLYKSEDCVRVKGASLPKLADVVGTPFCDVGWQRQGDELILVSAIDNLLKGAASQAIQCVNLHHGWDSRLSLV